MFNFARFPYFLMNILSGIEALDNEEGIYQEPTKAKHMRFRGNVLQYLNLHALSNRSDTF